MNQHPQQGPPRQSSSDKLLKIIGCIAIIIVVPIVLIFVTAILASIALPMYVEYKTRGDVIQTEIAMIKIGDRLAERYVQDAQFPAFEDTDTLSEVTGVPLNTQNKTFTMDSLSNVVAVRITFVGSKFEEGNSLLLRVDCSAQPCNVEVVREGEQIKRYFGSTDNPLSQD